MSDGTLNMPLRSVSPETPASGRAKFYIDSFGMPRMKRADGTDIGLLDGPPMPVFGQGYVRSLNLPEVTLNGLVNWFDIGSITVTGSTGNVFKVNATLAGLTTNSGTGMWVRILVGTAGRSEIRKRFVAASAYQDIALSTLHTFANNNPVTIKLQAYMDSQWNAGTVKDILLESFRVI